MRCGYCRTAIYAHCFIYSVEVDDQGIGCEQFGSLLELLGHFIDYVIAKDTPSQFATLITSDTSSDFLMTDVYDFRFHVSLIQLVSHYAQSRIGAAVSVRASVN